MQVSYVHLVDGTIGKAKKFLFRSQLLKKLLLNGSVIDFLIGKLME